MITFHNEFAAYQASPSRQPGVLPGLGRLQGAPGRDMAAAARGMRCGGRHPSNLERIAA